MDIACLDFEGVLVPEIWIEVAERTGIADLRLTTRDIPDYDELMARRLAILDKEKIRLPEIQAIIGEMGPLPGALDFLTWLRERFQLILLSDTFYEFVTPLLSQLGWPTMFCHRLIVATDGQLTGYRLRQPDAKQQAVKALHGLNFRVVAAGDSYNDTTMLAEADQGVLFNPPAHVAAEFPQFPVARDYEQLRRAFLAVGPVVG